MQSPQDASLSIIAAVDATSLWVYPLDAVGEKQLALAAGDVVVLRGDVGHAGPACSSDEWILHAYLDSRVQGYRRVTTEPIPTYAFSGYGHLH